MITNIRRFTIRNGEEKIKTNTYIHIFNKPHIPNEVKISNCLESVEQYVPAPLRRFKSHKLGHHWEVCRGRNICAKFTEKDPNHTDEECTNEMKCANCRQNHSSYKRSCDIYKGKNEILQVHQKKNISFAEARK